MFLKLLKHEFKATSKIELLLCLFIVIGGVIGGLLVKALSLYGDKIMEYTGIFWPSILIVMVMLIAVLLFGIALSIIGYQAPILYRFYKNKFTDEGYLTFTLPVKAWEIWWSSVIPMMLWGVVITALAAVSGFFIFAFGLETEGFWDVGIWELGKDMLNLIFDGWAYIFGKETVIIEIVLLIASSISGCILPMFSIVLGCLIAKKYKPLASIGAYYLLYTCTSVISTMISGILLVFLEAAGVEIQAYAPLMITGILNIGIAVTGSLISIKWMKTKLNL